MKMKGMLIRYDADEGRSKMPELVDVDFEDEGDEDGPAGPMLDSVKRHIGCQWVDAIRLCDVSTVWINDEGRLEDQRVNVYVRRNDGAVFDLCGSVLITLDPEVLKDVTEGDSQEARELLIALALKHETLTHVRPAPPNTTAREPKIEVKTFDVDLSKRVN